MATVIDKTDVADNVIDPIENSTEAAIVTLFSIEDANDVNNVDEKSIIIEIVVKEAAEKKKG